MNWPMRLRRMERLVWVGPEDEFDDETNGDPDSTKGEDDESGFDEMADWPDEDDEDGDDGDDEDEEGGEGDDE